MGYYFLLYTEYDFFKLPRAGETHQIIVCFQQFLNGYQLFAVTEHTLDIRKCKKFNKKLQGYKSIVPAMCSPRTD